MTETDRLLGAILQELQAIRTALGGVQRPVGEGAQEAPEEGVQLANAGVTDTAVGEVGPAAAAETPGAAAAVAWLEAHGVGLRRVPPPAGADAVFDRLANTLGSRFQLLCRLHDQLRRSLGTGQPVALSLSDRPQEEIAACTAFAHELSQLAILTRYQYHKPTRTLQATVRRAANVTAFFTGGWFERYVALQCEQVLAAAGQLAAPLQNAQVVLPNGDAGELDLFYVVAGSPLWIECKTGDYQQHVWRYSELRQRLGVPSPRALLVLLGQTAHLCQELSALCGLAVCNEQTLPAALRQVLGTAEPVSDGPPALPPLAAPTSPAPLFGRPVELTAWLTRCGLRPLPAIRPAILAALLDLWPELPRPLTLREVKAQLAARQTATGSQIQDVLQAVLRGGALVGPDDLPVVSFTQPVASLASPDAAALEACCCRAYRQALLLPDAPPGLWPVDPADFSAATGGLLPGPTA